jgi:hypothetical protein
MSQCKTFTGWPRVQCVRYEGHDGDHKFPGDIVVVEAPAVLPHRLTPNETSERQAKLDREHQCTGASCRWHGHYRRNEDWRTRALEAERAILAWYQSTPDTRDMALEAMRVIARKLT